MPTILEVATGALFAYAIILFLKAQEERHQAKLRQIGEQTALHRGNWAPPPTD
jgi:hypothetical protein